MPHNYSNVLKEVLKIGGPVLFDFLVFIITQNNKWKWIFYVFTLVLIFLLFLYFHLAPLDSNHRKLKKYLSIGFISVLIIFLSILSYSEFFRIVSGKESPQTPTNSAEIDDEVTSIEEIPNVITINPPTKIITPTQEFPGTCISNLWLLSPEYLNNVNHISSNKVCPDYSSYGFITKEKGLEISINNSPTNTYIVGLYKLIPDSQYSVTIKIGNWQSGIQNNQGHFYFGFCDHTAISSCTQEYLNIAYVGEDLKPEIYLYDNNPIYNVTNSDGEIVIICDKYPDEVICRFPYGTDTRTIPIGSDPDSIFLGYDILEGSTIKITIPELTISPLY